MADKTVIIKGKKMLYGNSVKASPETNSTTTPTFDGVITQGTDKVSWNIEIGKMRYEGLATHQKLSETLDEMLSIPHNVTVREIVYPKNEDPYVIVDTFYSCLLDGNDYELNPEDLTTESIKFKASKRKRVYETIS